jgi:hypothetical protein
MEALKQITEQDKIWNTLEPIKQKLTSHVDRMEKIIHQNNKEPLDF